MPPTVHPPPRRRAAARRWGAWRLACAVAVIWTSAARAETLTLTDCLREVVEHNPTVARERLAIEGAYATRLTLRARALPSLGIGGIVGQLDVDQNVAPGRKQVPPATPGASPTYVRTPGRVETSSQFIALATGTLYQPLFDAGIPASYRRGTVGIRAAEQNFYSAASTQMHAARLLFCRAIYLRENGQILREIDENLAANVQTQNKLVTAGLVGRGPQLTAQVQRTNFGSGIDATGGEYRTILGSLLQTMGRELPFDKDGADPLGRIILSGTLDEQAPAFDAAEAVRVATARRPDLRALRELVKVQQEEANIAKAGYYPLIRLYVAGEYVPESNVRSQPNAIRQSDQVRVSEIRPGVSGSWVIIDPGTTRGAVRTQEAERDTAALGLRRLETNLPAEIATVRARLSDATSRLDVLRGNVETGQGSLKIIEGGLAQGLNTQLEYRFAQNDLISLRTGLLTARLEMSLAHAELDRLMGNYLRYVEDQPGPTDRRTTRK